MNVIDTLSKLQVIDSTTESAIPVIRERISKAENPFDEASSIANMLGVELKAFIKPEDDSRARLFATSLVAYAMAHKDTYSVEEAIANAKDRVANLEKMGLVRTPKIISADEPKAKKEKAPKKPKTTGSKRSYSPKKEATKLGFETAESLYKANPGMKTKDLVKLIAEACQVNETRAYYFLYWPRRQLLQAGDK
jgi:hypothetical protein